MTKEEMFKWFDDALSTISLEDILIENWRREYYREFITIGFVVESTAIVKCPTTAIVKWQEPNTH